MKRKLANDRNKAVSYQNTQIIHDIHEKLLRDRQAEIAREKERLYQEQIFEQEKLNLKM